MKKPDTHALRTLKKAPITNPVVAASTETPAVPAGNRISLSEWATTIITDHINTDVTPVPAGATPKGII
ncbi:hypothetical protein [Actinotignum sp. GS-2025b]|uniref:hypothetical protein n=1 Tax=Actinotignum sp. GS-2025b TaxID=3427275 RepID=UPI003F48F013